MNNTQREQMRAIVRDVKGWIAAATDAEAHRAGVEAAAQASEEHLRNAGATIVRAGQTA